MKKYSKNNLGFTLIELLVVVGVVGALSSVVVVSVNDSRIKGADAAVKSNLSSIRSQAELIYTNNGCYAEGVNSGSLCHASGYTSSLNPPSGSVPAPNKCPERKGTDSSVYGLDVSFRPQGMIITVTSTGTVFVENGVLSSIKKAIDNSAGLHSCVSTDGQSTWAIAVQLKSDPKTAWCIDSLGASKKISNSSNYTQATLNSAIESFVCGS